MAVEHYAPYRWVQAPIAALSLWLIASPATLGTASPAIVVSDLSAGLVALSLSIAALGARRGLACWAISLVGLWLLFAPLAFHAPDAASYANDTLVGALLIGFGLVLPMSMRMPGSAVPPGWTYNPSAWLQRAPSIALALLSFLVARWMAAFQLGHVATIHDPFFGNGSERVLTSAVSRAWPVSDAGLGALTYLVEVLMGLMGDERRWRTMPWMVAGFGFVVVPLGVVSITLVILQPIAVGAWCTPCLFTAAAMLLMIPLSLDEVVAMIQLVARERRAGRSAWRVFWLGAEAPSTAHAEESRDTTWSPRGMLWGVTGSSWLWVSMAAGAWLMAAPSALGIPDDCGAADSDHLVGALVVVVAVVALAEVARPVRFLNVLLGLWLLGSPWLLAGETTATRVSGTATGLVVLLAALPLGRLRDHYGSYDRMVVWSPRAAARQRHARTPWVRRRAGVRRA